jgi:DNA-binding CsgD family transcriptional regulator
MYSVAETDPSIQQVDVVGRAVELRALRRFFDAARAACLVVTGEQGIGKTALWEAALELAATSGYAVLAARAGEAESLLSYAALSDLVEEIGDEALERLPPPQLRALEVAVRRAEPGDEPPDPLAISAGLLGALRYRGQQGPVLVAIDDVQWLDQSSAVPLRFAARRLSDGTLRFLLTRRTGARSDFEKALSPSNVERLAVGALTFGATARLLSDRIGPALPRRLVRRVHQASHGNPLFALELGRLLAEDGHSDYGSELPLPDIADDLFGGRVRGLDGEVRTALLAVALEPSLSSADLESIVGSAAVQEAISEGLLVRERHWVRASHPMLAATTRRESVTGEQEALHAQLAAAIGDPVLRARHLALARKAPDEGVASVVSSAADIAAGRAATDEAHELAGQALRLTPPESPEYPERTLRLARACARAADWSGLKEVLNAAIDNLPAGRFRALALGMRAEWVAQDVRGFAADTEQALADAGDDPEARSRALSVQSRKLSLKVLERLEEAEVRAREAVATAPPSQLATVADAKRTLAWARVLRGASIDDLRAQDPLPQELSPLDDPTGRPFGVRLACRGQIDEAEEMFGRLMGVAETRGELTLALSIEVQLCELELRAGRVAEAAERLAEVDVYLELFPVGDQMISTRLRALLSATKGSPTEARRLATRVLDAAAGAFTTWDRLEADRVIGLAAAFEHDPAAAVESFGAVWRHMMREGVTEPGVFPVAGELVEALVDSGDLAAATEVSGNLEQLSAAQEHPWGGATARRCHALLELARTGDIDAATTTLASVAATYGGLGLRFDEARTLLTLGRAQRRNSQRSAARKTLSKATELFASLGCTGWAAQARSELAQVSGRRPNDGALTPSERSVVELASEGLSNKEIAARLFVSTHTVETHLTHAYSKLGVRSRSQLAARIRAISDNT